VGAVSGRCLGNSGQCSGQWQLGWRMAGKDVKV
jgi:hypothetical protein